jgi:hypothetical protein
MLRAWPQLLTLYAAHAFTIIHFCIKQALRHPPLAPASHAARLPDIRNSSSSRIAQNLHLHHPLTYMVVVPKAVFLFCDEMRQEGGGSCRRGMTSCLATCSADNYKQ